MFSSILLVGGGARLTGLPTYLQSKLNSQVSGESATAKSGSYLCRSNHIFSDVEMATSQLCLANLATASWPEVGQCQALLLGKYAEAEP
jgi:hypothetical protein